MIVVYLAKIGQRMNEHPIARDLQKNERKGYDAPEVKPDIAAPNQIKLHRKYDSPEEAWFNFWSVKSESLRHGTPWREGSLVGWGLIFTVSQN
jgi:hypothetical protein